MIHHEYKEQVKIFQWAKWNLQKYPELALLQSSQNAGKRTAQAGIRSKQAGMLKGTPDILLPVPKGQYASLWIELKRKDATKSGISKEQILMLKLLTYYGNCAEVCFGADEAIKCIETYLQPLTINIQPIII